MVDFFGIFFTFCWVFYSNEELMSGSFLGYFTIIGQVWIYKILISVLPFVVGMIVFWMLFYVWDVINDICDYDNCCYNICTALFWLFCATSGFLIGCCVVFIALEVFCFTIVAFLVFCIVTQRWEDFDGNNAEKVKHIANFIEDGSSKWGNNDKIVRVLAVTHGLHQINSANHAGILRKINIDNKDSIKSFKLRCNTLSICSMLNWFIIVSIHKLSSSD